MAYNVGGDISSSVRKKKAGEKPMPNDKPQRPKPAWQVLRENGGMPTGSAAGNRAAASQFGYNKPTASPVARPTSSGGSNSGSAMGSSAPVNTPKPFAGIPNAGVIGGGAPAASPAPGVPGGGKSMGEDPILSILPVILQELMGNKGGAGVVPPSLSNITGGGLQGTPTASNPFSGLMTQNFLQRMQQIMSQFGAKPNPAGAFGGGDPNQSPPTIGGGFGNNGTEGSPLASILAGRFLGR
jgi:hypothetical protein